MNLADMPLLQEQQLEVDRLIDAACNRIAPLWPLKHFVAVNPYFGLRDHSFQDASDALARVIGTSLYMPRSYFREQLASGRITRDDIREAIGRCASTLHVESVLEALATDRPQPRLGMATVSDLVDKVEGGLWTHFVVERISMHCAAYFDMGQAMIGMPGRDLSLFETWREIASIDRSPALMGMDGMRSAIAMVPQSSRAAITWAVRMLDIPAEATERYLHAALLSVGGWAAWARYLQWQAELAGQSDASIVDLLAIRLTWDVLLFQGKGSAALQARWREMLAASMRAPSAKRRAASEVDRILLNAMEIGFQNTVVAALKDAQHSPSTQARPAVQAAFCIDVRSEVFRRSLEIVAPSVQTLGFAGFFGIFIKVVPLGADHGHSHVPILFTPTYCVHEEGGSNTNHLRQRRRDRLKWVKVWKGFKFSASSCFSFVESVGLTYAPKLLSDSMGWSRPVPDPKTQGLGRRAAEALSPSLSPLASASGCSQHGTEGIPESERVNNAERILRAMGLTGPFARLVVLVGHGSSSVNNPHATSLDCGACAGQTGEASARVVAELLNDRSVRMGLASRGIKVPDDTWFLGALHDTTTDTVRLFDKQIVPDHLSTDLIQLEQWLDQAGDLTRMQRAPLIGLGALTDRDIARRVHARSRDWSQVRPEWALANNAAFIAAPRSRTRGANLGGRAFLHDYVWKTDADFKVLELIMTAPMVVANWINMQYYGSVVDNLHFGSGNKVLHNVVGGAIGVLEGNGGDLRVGLPLQSLHDGARWMHEPLRLSVFLEAPAEAIDDIIARHDLIRQLVDNGWLHVFRIDDTGDVIRRARRGIWLAPATRMD
ncbi:MAG: DUF2309 domain-containing protein [Betaproteobacteria bacterium]|nr:DUF2309 domain-containing protein [Betaproteobacteria bacterium]